MTGEKAPFASFAIVELLGHVRFAAYVTEGHSRRGPVGVT